MAPPDPAKLPSFLNNPCHNCRKRRLRCDRSRPTCIKCTNSGKECLGYDRLFIWTDGCAIPTVPGGADGGGRSRERRIGSLGSEHQFGRAGTILRKSKSSSIKTEPSSPTLSDASPWSTTTWSSGGTFGLDDDASQQQVASFTCGRERKSFSELSTCSLTSLTDPLFQDLDRLSCQYLSHFADWVCRDLVAHDGPESNPFRELIPLAVKHPFLLHILVATSAIHMSNISHPRLTAPSHSTSSSSSSSSLSTTSAALLDPGSHLQYLRHTTAFARRCFLDGLQAKQQALECLRIALDNADTDEDVVLAAVLFFVNFELIDFGKSSWATHLHGASDILALLKPKSGGQGPSRLLRDCIVADFVIYHILGSTLTSAGLAARIAKHAMNLLPVLERVESNNYLCCPPAILRIILEASQLSATSPPSSAGDHPQTTRRAVDLVRAALAFDIPAWALAMQPHMKVPDRRSREHVATAHRLAVVLYILRAIPSAREVMMSSSPSSSSDDDGDNGVVVSVRPEDLLAEMLDRLSLVDERDPHFKATSWPTFIAGAETTDPHWRLWSLGRLLSVWACCPWGYVVTAVDLLREMWRTRDSEAEPCWLRQVWHQEHGYLIV